MADPDATALSKALSSRNKARQQEALNAFLVAADTMAKRGEVIEAELRYKQALNTAEKAFGLESDQVVLVLSILAAFYRVQNRAWDARSLECRIEAWQMQQSGQKEPELRGALGQKLSEKIKSSDAAEPAGTSLKALTPNIRRACQILGLSLDQPITVQDVNRAWKKQMLESSAHPDLGGNSDEAVILNQAKVALMEYLELHAPKLGSKFAKKNPPST
jgi:hypothetical protein